MVHLVPLVRALLGRVDRLAPRAVDDLRKLLPLDVEARRDDDAALLVALQQGAPPAATAALGAAIEAWAARWRLSHPLAEAAAASFLRHHAERAGSGLADAVAGWSPLAHTWAAAADPAAFCFAPAVDAPDPRPAAWDPRREPWATFKARMAEGFEAYARTYRAGIEGAFARAGYEPGAAPRDRGHGQLAAADWLVMHRCLGLTFDAIADRCADEHPEGAAPGPDAIGKAVRRLADTLGLS